MQRKISGFFKPSSSSYSSPFVTAESPPLSDTEGGHSDSDCDLSSWMNKQHDYVNTYKRRPSKSNGELTGSGGSSFSEPLEEIVTEDVHSNREPARLGKTVNKNKKRSYAQLHLELGQSDFLLHTCSTCGMKYSCGDEVDEDVHKTFHKSYTRGIQFKGWKNERVVHLPSLEIGRILLVRDGDPPAHKNKVQEIIKMVEMELAPGWIYHKHCKVYLFISSQRITGCLVVEPIKEAFRVISCTIDRETGGSSKKQRKSVSATLQFGAITFQREIVKKVPSNQKSETLGRSMNGTILCGEDSVPAACGIRAIWVAPSCRRKHIATQLLDAMRKSFCMGYALEKSQVAFSEPTSSGKALASSYFGTRSFLVYKADISDN